MQFLLEPSSVAVTAVGERLKAELTGGKKVLWLISGGSQIDANTQIMNSIPTGLSANLSVMPMDERYGQPGHSDSNWAQQIKKGFDGRQAKLFPVLIEGLDFAATAKRYGDMLGQAINQNDIIIGQFGIGPDGHTAGILPNSLAAREDNNLIEYYEAPPLKRLTLTFNALRQIDVGYALAYGDGKKQALANLQQTLPLNQQPAQIIKELSEAYVYNDQVGEKYAR